MKKTGKTILKLISGYLIGIPILYIFMESMSLLRIYEPSRLMWVNLSVFFIWFYLAGLINRNTKPLVLLFLYPIICSTIVLQLFYFPMIAYLLLFASVGLMLTRKELSKKIKFILSVSTTILFGYFLFSQALIIKQEGFGYDTENNLLNATVVWDFSTKSLPTVPTEIFLDQNGQKINLNQFKGKTIYITFWATWCGPCLSEKPELEKLKQEMAGNNEVVFVDISIDSNKAIWNSYVIERKPKGIQLISQNISKTTSNFQISGVPHHIIVNNEGFYKSCHGPQLRDWADILSNSSAVNDYVKSPRKIIDKAKMNNP